MHHTSITKAYLTDCTNPTLGPFRLNNRDNNDRPLLASHLSCCSKKYLLLI